VLARDLSGFNETHARLALATLLHVAPEDITLEVASASVALQVLVITSSPEAASLIASQLTNASYVAAANGTATALSMALGALVERLDSPVVFALAPPASPPVLPSPAPLLPPLDATENHQMASNNGGVVNMVLIGGVVGGLAVALLLGWGICKLGFTGKRDAGQRKPEDAVVDKSARHHITHVSHIDVETTPPTAEPMLDTNSHI